MVLNVMCYFFLRHGVQSTEAQTDETKFMCYKLLTEFTQQPATHSPALYMVQLNKTFAAHA